MISLSTFFAGDGEIMEWKTGFMVPNEAGSGHLVRTIYISYFSGTVKPRPLHFLVVAVHRVCTQVYLTLVLANSGI